MSDKKDSSLVKIAYELAFNNMETAMMTWWSRKYNKPIMYDSVDKYTTEELAIEFYIHKLIDDPNFKKQCELDLMQMEEQDEEWLKQEMGETYVNPMTTATNNKNMTNNNEDEIRESFMTKKPGRKF